MAEISGFTNTLQARRQKILLSLGKDPFGGAGDQTKAPYWGGLCPMTPDGTPFIGATPLANLRLNTGHGALDRTMPIGPTQVWLILSGGIRPRLKLLTPASRFTPTRPPA